MGSITLNKSKAGPLQKLLIFLICIGRLDGVLYETDFVFAGLILLALIGLLVNIRQIIVSKYLLWQLLLIIYFACSILWAYDKEQAMVILIAYIGRTIILLYIFSFLVRYTEVIYVCKSFVLATIITTLHLFAEFGISGMIEIRAETITTTQGWNANALGIMCVTACFMIVYLIKGSIQQVKGLYFFTLIYLIIFILMTGSKTCFLLLFGPPMLSSYLTSKNKAMSIMAIGLFIFVLYYLIYNVPFLYNILGERIDEMVRGFSSIDSEERNASDGIRFTMLLVGWEWFTEQPLLGHGVGNFQALFGDFINNGKRLYAHNNYIEMLVNGGIVGALLYYSIYIYIIRFATCFTNKRVGLAMISFIIVLMICEFGLVNYLVFCVQLLLMIFIYMIIIDHKH